VTSHESRTRHIDRAHRRFRLPIRPPYDWEAILGFLGARATPGVESVANARYRRTITIDGTIGSMQVARTASGSALQLDVWFPDPEHVPAIVERARNIFDVAADPAIVARHLNADPLLQGALARHQGIRVPGAWHGFELAVRAIIGQQVTVRGATTLAGRVASMFGSGSVDDGDLGRLFPTPAQLADAPVERVGIVRARAEAIRSLARHAAEGTIAFDGRGDAASTIAVLGTLPGIGSWTTAYIAMRAFGDRDAFPSGDRVLCRMAGDRSARELDRRSESWRPWRAYAVILLWQAATDAAGGIRSSTDRSQRSRTTRSHRNPRSLKDPP
jgi:AraC family transcriptional regulator, regulatory protein of adaptative response / DNA-3-methyladenine glycosylase II